MWNQNKKESLHVKCIWKSANAVYFDEVFK